MSDELARLRAELDAANERAEKAEAINMMTPEWLAMHRNTGELLKQVIAERDTLRAELAAARKEADGVAQEAADLCTQYCNERDALRAELAAANEKLDAYEMDGAAAAMAVKKAEADLAARDKLISELRLGIAVLGDTTKHLGLQLGQDTAAAMIARIDALLNGGGE